MIPDRSTLISILVLIRRGLRLANEELESGELSDGEHRMRVRQRNWLSKQFHQYPQWARRAADDLEAALHLAEKHCDHEGAPRLIAWAEKRLVA